MNCVRLLHYDCFFFYRISLFISEHLNGKRKKKFLKFVLFSIIFFTVPINRVITKHRNKHSCNWNVINMCQTKNRIKRLNPPSLESFIKFIDPSTPRDIYSHKPAFNSRRIDPNPVIKEWWNPRKQEGRRRRRRIRCLFFYPHGDSFIYWSRNPCRMRAPPFVWIALRGWIIQSFTRVMDNIVNRGGWRSGGRYHLVAHIDSTEQLIFFWIAGYSGSWVSDEVTLVYGTMWFSLCLERCRTLLFT